jgi:hypothetical protein
MNPRHLKTWPSVITYIRKYSIYQYLNIYHYGSKEEWTESWKHNGCARTYLKKHYIIYKKQIELWEKLHGLKPGED